MSQAFTVCVSNLSVHYQCWNELAESVRWALTELGHDATVGRVARPGTRAIHFTPPPYPVPPDTIFYNTEQAGDEGGWQSNHLPDAFRGHIVWDYSRANARRYARYGLPQPVVVRPGYCPTLVWDGQASKKTHDVVFFGSSNPRREELLRQIEQRGLSLLRVPFGLYGRERDAVIAQARLCLNIHFYESVIFEAVRCSLLAMGGVPVLSETSAGDDASAYGMEGASYEDMAGYAHELLMKQDLLADLARLQRKSIQENVPMLDEVAAALEALDRPALHSLPVPEAKPTERPQLTLCMIVKDERDVIERCLASVLPHIDQWCIVDTGSTDGTQQLIETFLADVPGKLYERSWKEYAGSRTEAIELAQALCQRKGWLLLIDADEIFTIQGALEIPELYDGYNAWITRCIGCKPWGRTTFLRASKPWFYQLPRHEGIYCRIPAPSRAEPIANVLILSTSDGARSRQDAYERYLEDARVLEKWLKENPQHPERGRAQYYIAQSYRDAATGRVPFDRAAMQRAVASYMKRATMGSYDQEVHSALLWAADCMRKLDYPWQEIQQRYLEAFNQRPQRAEGLFHVGEHYRKLGQYALAELFLRQAAALPLPGDIFPDVDRSIYEWKAKEEWGVALSWLGRWTEARDLFREVLKQDVPADERKRIEQNFQESLKNAPE